MMEERTNEILQLSPCLFDDAILTSQNDAHATQVINLSRADDEGIDIESSGGEDSRNAREHSGLVLDEAVERVAREGLEGGGRSWK